jgi:hypothetical protein
MAMEVWEQPQEDIQPIEQSKGLDKLRARALRDFIEDKFRPGQFRLEELEGQFMEDQFITNPDMPINETVFFRAIAQLLEEGVLSADKKGNYRLRASA